MKWIHLRKGVDESFPVSIETKGGSFFWFADGRGKGLAPSSTWKPTSRESGDNNEKYKTGKKSTAAQYGKRRKIQLMVVVHTTASAGDGVCQVYGCSVSRVQASFGLLFVGWPSS